jgi:hypothetical protein
MTILYTQKLGITTPRFIRKCRTVGFSGLIGRRDESYPANGAADGSVAGGAWREQAV